MEEHAICRVCRMGSSTTQPLFHPCRCSGSIKYIHQDCLLEWLSHSKKKYCEVCDYAFVFTSIYRKDMPSRIPIYILFQNGVRQLFIMMMYTIRSLIALCVWLIFLPLLTLWVWRFYLWMLTERDNSLIAIPLSIQHSIHYLTTKQCLDDCLYGLAIMVAVILFAVTGYVFKEWVIRTAAQLETRENEAPRRASGASTIVQDQERLRVRLEQLSRELESRNRARRPSFTLPSVSDDFFSVMSAPNGEQSPFAAWRDYQQQATPSFTQTRTWRAREFDTRHQIAEREDYFGPQDMRPTGIQPLVDPVEREEEEAAFDLIESKDKILETMGIYGSPLNLLKTPFLMSVMISLCLGITVWVPYIMGQAFLLGLPFMDKAKQAIYLPGLKSLPFEAMLDPWIETLQSIKLGLYDSIIRYKIRDPAAITLNVAVGYFVLILMGSWYLDHARSRMSVTSIQQRTVWKVLLFILLELILFPTSCGLFLDLSTLPYFQATSLVRRMSFLQDSPCSGLFLYWFTGTGFIQLFLEVISHVREVVRPGVLWFIRDPHDPEFHPMQELIRQPIRHLLWRFVCHVAIYFLLIMVGMGCVGIVVCKTTPVCPILWTFDIPWSTLPLDLLAVPFLVPRAMRHVLPREFSKRSVMTWWHIVARVLRLSSFMFGQEGEVKNKSGYMARVPAYDRVGYHGSRPMVVPVEAHTGIPLNERDRRLGHPAGSGPGQTTIVHIPPLFYLRMVIFLLLIWFTGSILVCSMAFVPLLLGRHVLVELLGFHIAHDVYPFAVGACLMMAMSALFNIASQCITFFYKYRGKVNLTQCKHNLSCIAQQLLRYGYLSLVLGIIIPFLIGCWLDLYIFIPIKLSIHHVEKIDLYIFQDWSVGVVSLSLVYGLMDLVPGHIARPFWREIDWTTVDLWKSTQNLLAPFIVSLVLINLVPSVFTFGLLYILAIEDPSIRILVFRCAYPLLLCISFSALAGMTVLRLLHMWVGKIRDDTYLVSRLLHNVETSSP